MWLFLPCHCHRHNRAPHAVPTRNFSSYDMPTTCTVPQAFPPGASPGLPAPAALAVPPAEPGGSVTRGLLGLVGSCLLAAAWRGWSGFWLLDFFLFCFCLFFFLSPLALFYDSAPFVTPAGPSQGKDQGLLPCRGTVPHTSFFLRARPGLLMRAG